MPTGPLTGSSKETVIRALTRGGLEYVVRLGLGFVMVPLVLGHVGPEQFGVWAVVSSVLTIGGLADLGIRTEITRRVASAWGSGDRRAAVRAAHEGTAILAVTGIAVALAGVVLAPDVARWSFPRGVAGISQSEIVALLRASAFLVGFGLVADGYFSALRGVQRSDLESLCRVLGEVAGSLVTILWVLAGGGLWAVLTGLAVQLAVDYGARFVALRKVVPELGLRLAGPRGLRIWVAAVGLLTISQVADVIDTQWDKLVLSRYVGSAAAAAYNVGTTLPMQAKVLVVIPLVPLLTAAAEMARPDGPRFRAMYDALGSASYTLAGIALGAVAVFGPAFLNLWIGEGRLPGAGLAAELSVVAVSLNILTGPLTMLVVGLGRARLSATSAASNLVVNGVGSVLLTIHIGFRGALYGSILGNLVGLVVLVVGARRAALLNVPPLRCGLAAGAISLVAWVAGVGRSSGWGSLVVGATAFLAVQVVVVLLVAGPVTRARWRGALPGRTRTARDARSGAVPPGRPPG